MTADPNFAWQVDVDPQGTDEGAELDGTDSGTDGSEETKGDGDGDGDGDDSDE